MDTPMAFAMLDPDGAVANVIWLRASERLEFPNIICVEDRPVVIGDKYVDGAFLRDGTPVPTYRETIDQLSAALGLIEEAFNEEPVA